MVENEHEEKSNEKQTNRRNFFIRVGNVIISVVTAGGLGIIYKYLSPNVLLESPARFRVGPPDDFQPNTVLFDEEHRVFVVRDAKGYFYALSAVCTHLGCTTVWKKQGSPGSLAGPIHCPCHGSIFSRDGHVIRGPAPRPLDRFRMSLEDGILVVDTHALVSEEEMILRV